MPMMTDPPVGRLYRSRLEENDPTYYRVYDVEAKIKLTIPGQTLSLVILEGNYFFIADLNLDKSANLNLLITYDRLDGTPVVVLADEKYVSDALIETDLDMKAMTSGRLPKSQPGYLFPVILTSKDDEKEVYIGTCLYAMTVPTVMVGNEKIVEKAVVWYASFKKGTKELYVHHATLDTIESKMDTSHENGPGSAILQLTIQKVKNHVSGLIYPISDEFFQNAK